MESGIEQTGDAFLEEAYRDSIKELNDFYGINWTKDLPKVQIVPDRKSIDALRGKKTEPWVVGGRVGKDSVFLLDRKNYGTESNHTYSEAEYLALLKHELSHCFFHRLSGASDSKHSRPIWLTEGVAIYTAGQNVFKKRPGTFEKFLNFETTGGSGVYGEAGFVVELLVHKFGKEKLLELIKSLGSIKSTEEFNTKFKEIYDFDPSYEKFNGLWREEK
jgi:hypothetical protein